MLVFRLEKETISRGNQHNSEHQLSHKERLKLNKIRESDNKAKEMR